MQATGNKSNPSYSLSIRLAADGFSFYVNNPSSLLFVQHEEHRYAEGRPAVDTLAEALQTSALLKREFSSVRVLVNAPTAHIPLDVFKQDEAELLYRLTFADGTPREEHIFYNVSARPEMVTVAALPADVYALLHERYPTLRLFSTDCTLMAALLSYDTTPAKAKGRRLYVYLHEDGMNLYVPEEGKLLFANSFDCTPTADRMYFVLNVWRELQLDARRDTCLLLGSAPAVVALHEPLTRYLQNIEMPTPGSVFPTLPQTPAADLPFDLFTLLAYPD